MKRSVFVDERRVLDLAFEIDEALGDERRRRPASALILVRPKAANLSMSRPELLPISTTFSASSTAGIAITHSSRRAQSGEAVIAFADDAGDERRLEVDHHVPRHGHDVGAAALGRGKQDDRAQARSSGRPCRGEARAAGSSWRA